MSVSTETAPRVRVQLQLQSKDGHPKEVVRKSTVKGNEVVEVAGANFKFIRMSKAADMQPTQKEQPPQVDTGTTSTPAAEPAGPAPQDPSAASAEPVEPEQAGVIATDQAATPTKECSNRSPSAKDLIRPEGTSTPTPSVGPVQEEQMQQPEEQPEEQEEEPQPRPPRERDLNAEVASLLPFIPAECPAAVGVTWVLREALRLAVDLDDQEGQAAASAVLQSFQRGLDQQVASARRLLQGGPEQVRSYDVLPPMVRELCAGEPLMASLRQQLAALEQEERAWRSLEEKYREGVGASGAAGFGAAQQEEEAGDAAAPGTSGGGSGGGVGSLDGVQWADLEGLSVAQRRADVQLEFQVESVNSMLEKAERLVVQAQQACSLLQADYHKENFQSYNHINSPQVLVKILSQVPPTAGVDFVPSSQPSQC